MSRKRKYCEIEAGEASTTNFDAGVMHATCATNTSEKSSRKRVKRIVSSLMHTAAAVTVGAVATWSALAFS